MITINEIKIDDSKFLTGKIGKETYSIEHSKEALEELKELSTLFNNAETYDDAQGILEDSLDFIKTLKSTETSDLTAVLEDDLYFDKKARKYYIKHEEKMSIAPVHSFFVNKMVEANEKGVSPKPWLIFWVRLMRNELYINNPTKVENMVTYLKALYVDSDASTKLQEEGYAVSMADKLSTFDQISITEQGILAAFKYVDLIDQKFIVETNEETGEQEIKKINKYKRELEVDPISGEITKDELVLPEIAEEFDFLPPIMGSSGDAFTCRDIDEPIKDAPLGHVVRVGKVHELTGFEQVNCDDATYGRQGLHLGGYYYVQGFGGKTAFLVDCLVAPEDIGAVADLSDDSNNSEGAIRCKRYMVTGAHFAVSEGMYHPSTYAKMLDDEWAAAKAEVIKAMEEMLEDVKKSV